METISYIESEDKLVIKTTYDATATIENNAAIRTGDPVTIGSKGQRMVLAASIPEEHVTALKNLGYNLLSPDQQEVRRTLCFIQSEQSAFLTTDKKMFALHRPKWQ
jgi:hypothetical protein